MDPKELPAAELATLTDGLLAALAEGAGAHTSARFHLDLQRTDDKLEIDSVRGGDLTSTDPEAASKGGFIGRNHYKASMALLKSAVAADCPLYLVHYDFRKESGQWKHWLTVQSLAEHEQMLKERATLDAAIEQALVDAAEKGWKELSASRSDVPPVQELKLLGTYGRKNRLLSVPPALSSVVDRLWPFHRERGFQLEAVELELTAGRRKLIRDFAMYYVPERKA